jgi:DNA-binding NtrC family response regulator
MSQTQVVLLVEGDVVVRHPLAEYLRKCGFEVVEVVNGDEAMAVLNAPNLRIEVVLADMTTPGSGFPLRQWIRTQKPTVDVILAGTIEKTVEQAGKLCNDGPAFAKPYEYHIVLDHIRRTMARRDQDKT